MNPPASASAPVAAKPKPTRADQPRDILAAFSGTIEPVRVPPLYRLGILAVAAVMVLLPLIYLGMIALVAMGVHYHAVHHTGILTAGGSGRARGMALLVYLAPMIIGPILVLFMFKPLLSRPAKAGKKRSLSREKEPLLFAFVERICEVVRAPRPRRIDVDCEVNASASFRRGLWSLFGHDLVLTIGMPLVAGLNLRQFAGVLAHEFGHFSQGAGMRLTYIIRSISHWFTRVVYERDEWDERLVRWSEGIDLRIGWIFYIARMFVWLTRKVLWLLMIVGHAVAGLMLRQMEFDADRHEARLAGSDTFEATARQLAVLNIGSYGARSDLGEFYREGRLADNLPKLILHNVTQFTPETHAQIDRMIAESKTGAFDTHPCDSDRIASARRENAAGIFRLEQPASVLFRDFNRLSMAATWDFYREAFGRELRREDLFRTEELIARQSEEHESYKALERYFQGAFSVARPLPVAEWSLAAPEDVSQAEGRLKRSRNQLVMLPPASAAASEAEASNEPSPPDPERERLGSERLFAALELLQCTEVAGRIDRADEWRNECERLLPVLELLQSQLKRTTALESALESLAESLNQLQEGRRDEQFILTVKAQMEKVARGIAKIRGTLTGVSYPFDHAKGEISIAEFAVPDSPDSENPVELYQAAGGLIESVRRLSARITGRLCVLAEQVEAALGLEPLVETSGACGTMEDAGQ